MWVTVIIKNRIELTLKCLHALKKAKGHYKVITVDCGSEDTLQNIIKFKDAGINYQRVNVGLGEKGKSDLGKRLLYSGERESLRILSSGKEKIYVVFLLRKRLIVLLD